MAGSTYSSNLKIELMATGENSGTWGDITNTNLGTALEQAVIGLGTVDYVADANLTISITNSNASQAARALVLNVTSAFGSLTATRELVVPTIQKQYIVQNNTTGGQSITVKTSAGTGITVPNGRKAHLYVNGTDVIQMFDFVDINGGTIDGTPIGGSSAAAGAFTTLNASGATTLDGNVALGNASGDLITMPGTINSNLLFTDNTYDIGASGATRPRNLYLAGAATIGGNLSVGGTLTLTGGLILNGNVTVGDSSADTLTVNATITSNLLFTDNTYDIGASGATRPRNLFLAGNATIGGSQTLTGSLTVDSVTDTTSGTTGSIQTDGGIGVAKSVYVGSKLLLGTTSSGSSSVQASQAGINATSLTTTTVLNLGAKLGFTGVSNTDGYIFGGIAMGGAGEEYAGIAAYDNGSSAATGLKFFTGTTSGIVEAATVTSAGNWGIGISSPPNKLSVYAGGIVANFGAYGTGAYDDVEIQSYSGYCGIGTRGSTPLLFNIARGEVGRFASTGQFGVGFTPTNNNYLIQSNSGVRAGTSVVAQGSLQGYTGAGIFLSYESTYGRLESYDYATSTWKNVAITPNGGYVGFGTSTPATKVDIRGTSASVASTVQIVGNTVSTLLLGQNADGGVIRGQGGNNVLSFWTGGSGDTAASGSGSERMRITSTGSVAIGDNSAGSKLFVRSDSTDTTFTDQYNVATGSGITIQNESSTTGTWAALTAVSRNSSAVLQYASMMSVSASSGYSPNMVFVMSDSATTSVERMRVNSAGQLVVGTSSTSNGDVITGAGTTNYGLCSNRLNSLAANDNAGFIRFRGGNGSDSAASVEYGSIYTVATSTGAGAEAGDMLFYTRNAGNTAEKARLRSNGQFLVGVASPPATAATIIYANGNSTSYGVIGGRNGSGKNTVSVIGDNNFDCGYLGTSDPNSALALLAINSTYGTQFTIGGSEKMRLDSSGNLLVGYSTSPTGFGSGGIAFAPSVDVGSYNTKPMVSQVYSTTTAIPVYCGNWNSSGFWGIGTHTNGATIRIGGVSNGSNGWQWSGAYPALYSGSYTNASDYRLKENVQSYPDGALAQVLALRPVTYKMKDIVYDGENTNSGKQETVIGRKDMGFLAHEVQAVLPLLVSGEKDEMDAAGNEVHQGIDYSKMTTVLVKAIQELKAEFDAYKASHP